MRPGDSVYHERVVRLCEIAGDEGIINGFEFTGCHIRGPAVLVVQDSTLDRPQLRGTADALFWEIPPSRTNVIGAILAINCIFDRCTFENVGLAGSPEFIRQMKQGT